MGLIRIYTIILVLVSFSHLNLMYVMQPKLEVDQVQLIKSFGYPVEKHIVETDDGYVLTIIRIPHGKNHVEKQENYPAYNYSEEIKNRSVVYLQPCLCCSAAIYFFLGPKQSIAFLLADLGYDVWIPNSRGSSISRNHTTYNSRNSEHYWQFSWHEIGILDIPKTIDYILAYTNQKQVNYIGFSLGTTTLYVMLSEKPEYNEKIKVAFTYGPIAFMENVPPKKKIFSPFCLFKYFKPIFDLLNFLRIHDVGSVIRKFPLSTILSKVCNDNTSLLETIICTTVWNYLGNILDFYTPSLGDVRDMGTILSHYPDGCSVNSFEHYRQLNYKGGFTKFDFGRRQNLKVYGQNTPPPYNLSNIKAAVYLMYSDGDVFGPPEDVKKLHHLVSSTKLLRINHSKFRHADFAISKHAVGLVFNDIFKILRYYNS